MFIVHKVIYFWPVIKWFRCAGLVVCVFTALHFIRKDGGCSPRKWERPVQFLFFWTFHALIVSCGLLFYTIVCAGPNPHW